MAGAGLLSKDPEADYASDVFIGPRLKDMDRSIAIDYACHGIELERRSEVEIAGTFNAEISRAVRHESRRRESAEAFIAMYKRHGTTVRQVLEEQVRLNAAKLVDSTLEGTSLLALFIGQKYLPAGEHLSDAVLDPNNTEGREPSRAERLISNKLDEVLKLFKSRIETRAQKRTAKGKLRLPTKRDTILFAAIVNNLEGPSYCDFVDKHKVKPKWSENGPASYRASYMSGGSYRKKVQDEKSRAKQRMNRFINSTLMEAFIDYLPDQFDELSVLLKSRNSRAASKKLNPTRTA